MELWLLGAGAIVLIGITLWIVWPARTADAVSTTVLDEEEPPMTESRSPGLTPQGAVFEDQYTSATADLSAGGVASALDAMQENLQARSQTASQRAGEPWSAASTAGERIGQASKSAAFADGSQQPQGRVLVKPRTIGVGAGALMSVGGAVGGAWLFNRWQRERNKPINRLRRGARSMAHRLGELPEAAELPSGTAPIGGAASALLLTGLILNRAVRHPADHVRAQDVRALTQEMVRQSVREALGRGRDVLERGQEVAERSRKESRRLAARWPVERLPEKVETRKPAFMGLGFGGLALVAGGTFVIWRLLRGSDASRQRSYTVGE
jgi:hypothetical protein